MGQMDLPHRLITTGALRNTRAYNTISIGSVTGQLMKEFSFGLEAQWQPLLGADIPGSELVKKTGNTKLSSGILSQRYFANGAYLSIQPEFRIVEDNSEATTSKVISFTKQLANYLVVDEGPHTAGQAIGLIGGILAAPIIKAYQLGEKTGKAIGENGLIDGTVEAFTKVGEGISELLNSSIKNSRTVNVRIGNIFHCNSMILTNLQVTYSRELTKFGPLYADVSVTLETIQAANRGDDGFAINTMFMNTPPRVFTDGK